MGDVGSDACQAFLRVEGATPGRWMPTCYCKHPAQLRPETNWDLGAGTPKPMEVGLGKGVGIEISLRPGDFTFCGRNKM